MALAPPRVHHTSRWSLVNGRRHRPPTLLLWSTKVSSCRVVKSSSERIVRASPFQGYHRLFPAKHLRGWQARHPRSHQRLGSRSDNWAHPPTRPDSLSVTIRAVARAAPRRQPSLRAAPRLMRASSLRRVLGSARLRLVGGRGRRFGEPDDQSDEVSSPKDYIAVLMAESPCGRPAVRFHDSATPVVGLEVGGAIVSKRRPDPRLPHAVRKATRRTPVGARR